MFHRALSPLLNSHSTLTFCIFSDVWSNMQCMIAISINRWTLIFLLSAVWSTHSLRLGIMHEGVYIEICQDYWYSQLTTITYQCWCAPTQGTVTQTPTNASLHQWWNTLKIRFSDTTAVITATMKLQVMRIFRLIFSSNMSAHVLFGFRLSFSTTWTKSWRVWPWLVTIMYAATVDEIRKLHISIAVHTVFRRKKHTEHGGTKWTLTLVWFQWLAVWNPQYLNIKN